MDSSAAQEAGAAASPFCTSKTEQPSLKDLTGTWVARVTGAQLVVAPIISPVHNKYIFHILLSIRQNGTAIVADGKYCDRTESSPAGAVVAVVIPTPWAHTEKLVHRTGSYGLTSDGHQVLTFDQATEIAGAVLASPTDSLPTDVSDSRVIDEDNDGYPGITIALSGQSYAGSLYVVQAQTTAVSAILVDVNRLEGALTFSSAQVVMASDPTSIKTLFAQTQTSTDPTVCSSSFAMVKVAEASALDGGAIDASVAALDGGAGVDGGGGIGCEWVRANEAVLFP